MLTQQRPVMSLMQFGDALAGVAAVVAAVTFSTSGHAGVRSLPEALRLSSAALSAPVAALFGWTWHVCLTRKGLYENAARSFPDTFSRCASAVVQMSIAFGVLYIASHGYHGLLRAWLLFVVFSVLIELLRATLLTRIVSSVLEQRETALILGTGRRAQKAWRDLRIGNHSRTSFAGFVNDCDPEELPPDIRQRFVSRIADLPAFLQANHVDVLIVATSLGESFSLTRRAVAVAEAFDLRVLCLEDTLELGRSTVPTGASSIFSEVINHHRRSSSLLAIKNITDRMLALVLLIFSAPLQLCCCLAILASGTRPIFVTRRRYGYHRYPFDMLSLNTQLGVHPSGIAASGVANSTADEAPETGRPARIACLLRSTYLDRLPRLLNVVRGDMALVGPEPLNTTGSSPLENPEWELAFTAKPGLFRPSHLINRKTRSEANAIKADLAYLTSWSLQKDCDLLSRIFFGRFISIVLIIRRSIRGTTSLDPSEPMFKTISGDVIE